MNLYSLFIDCSGNYDNVERGGSINFTKFFYDDIKDKKRTASGVHSMKGKRGYVGKLYTTSDLLKGKAKREYQNVNKKVVTYNMYDKLITHDEFLKLSEDEQKKHLTEYRKRFSNMEIKRHWNLNNAQYYDKTIKRLGIQTSKGNRTKSKPQKKEPLKQELDRGTTVFERSEQVEQPIPVKTEPPETEGMEIRIKGTYTFDRLQNKLEKLALMLEDESEYEVNISIKEKNK